MIKETKNALQYAKAAHGSQLRAVGPDTGLPYFDTHVVRVTNAVIDWAKPAAALHDVIEDTDKNLYDLINTEWFSPETLVAVDLLTHRKRESYDDYISRMLTGDQWDLDDLLVHYAKDYALDNYGREHKVDFLGVMSDGRKIARRVKIADTMDNLITLPDGPLRRRYLGGLHALTEKYKLK
jgi:(p)ppGpp synthase/HD superfamily hydrolase